LVNNTAAKHLTDKTILLTGGTGSFCQCFVKIALQHNPKEIRIYSRGEFLQSEMKKKFNDERLTFIIGDVRDKSRLNRATKGVEIIVHAAALKQIPVGEDNPTEVIKTNVIGTMNVIDCALNNYADKVILISSDKACYPINLYGATKMISEKLFIQANSQGKTSFSCTRYGNVSFSRGSVIPLFLEQKKIGKLTLTHKDMTRFWITLEGGANFVIGCIGRMNGGEIFVPKLPSVRITDLAKVTAPEAEILEIGIRQGEKLHETLITQEEVPYTRTFPLFYIIDSFKAWNINIANTYSSDTNDWWLTENELKEMIRGLMA